MPDSSLLYQLVVKHVSGTATARETALLHVYAAFSTDDALNDALARAWEEHEARHHLSDEKGAAMFETILANAGPVRRGASILSWSYRAAAAVLLIGGGLWLHHHLAKPRLITPVVNIQPGQKGAMLTLSDGKVVNLDSLHNGQVAMQGSAAVSIREEQLVYEDHQSTREILYNTLSTPKGRQYSLVLPDGTRVWLNAATSITYPTVFSGNERRLKVSGEAYFEVAADAHKPFYVDVLHAGSIQVLGTSFAVNTYGDNGRYATTLFDGKIRVDAAGRQIVLMPGQQALISKESNGAQEMTLETQPDLEQALAWKNGIFNFRHANLNSVLQQLGRWYDLEIIYEGQPPNRVFGGEITMDLQLEQALRILQDMNVAHRIEGRKLIISGTIQKIKTNH
jgi:transmembrane sensor